MSKSKLVMTILVLSLGLLSLVGCNNEKASGGLVKDNEEVNKLEGTVIVDGSGTVYPLMAHIAEEYMINEEENVSVQVGRAGSSAGFKKFIPGETDFSDASRKIKEKEVAQLEENDMVFGEDVLEFVLAYDGLTIVINKENTWASDMTKEEIISMYLDSSHMTKWSDIRGDWPDDEIKFYGPNENHGTYEFFYEKILNEEEMVKSASLQQEYSTLVDLVSSDVNAVAYFGYGYYASNTDKLKAVNVDFGNGPIKPSLETIGMTLDYAGFTREVYTYLNVKHALAKPQVLDFAKYIVSLEGAKRLAGQNGFAPLPDDMYVEYQKQLDGIK